MVRKNIEMTTEEVETFLRVGWNLQVSTVGHDGWPHLTTLWYTIHEGSIAFRSFRRSQRIMNLKRDPRLTVLVEDGQSYADLRGVMVKGTAQLIEDWDTVMAIYGAVVSKYQFDGEPVGTDRLEALFGSYADKNTAVLVHAEHIASWDHRNLSGAY